MDHTLIFPKSQAKFPSNRSDWQWHEKVPSKLKELHNQGFKIVIFTNQGGIEKNKQDKSDITGKILDLASELGFPIQAFVAGMENHYRKPHTTMWEDMVQNYNHSVQVDNNVSFFCGDAAGRPKDWKKGAKKDFSVGDRQFAFNCKIQFHTPEALFLEEPECKTFEFASLDPTTLLNEKPTNLKKITSDKQELVIMVGRPASGKSTFTTKHFVPHGYVRVNRDTLGTPAKCKKAMEAAFLEGSSVVIDNTNPQSSARAEYIQVAQSRNIPVRCFYFTTSLEVANHLNHLRVRETNGVTRRIPPVAYHTYNKNFEEPCKSEGFDEIITVSFAPDFPNEKLKEWFLCYMPEFG